MSNKVSGELLPCPLCGGDATTAPFEPDVCCSNQTCYMRMNRMYVNAWQALPRTSAVNETDREIFDSMLGEEGADRIATHAEKPGACSHWIGGDVRGRCGRDEHDETPGERGPGKLGPFGGHGEPPAEKPGEGCGDAGELAAWIDAEIVEWESLGGQLDETEVVEWMYRVRGKVARLQSQPPSPIAAVVELLQSYVDSRDNGHAGKWPVAFLNDPVAYILAQLRESAPEPYEFRERHEVTADERKAIYDRAIERSGELGGSAQAPQSAPEPVRGQVWVVLNDETGSLVGVFGHESPARKFAEQWKKKIGCVVERRRIHDAQQAEQGELDAEHEYRSANRYHRKWMEAEVERDTWRERSNVLESEMKEIEVTHRQTEAERNAAIERAEKAELQRDKARGKAGLWCSSVYHHEVIDKIKADHLDDCAECNDKQQSMRARAADILGWLRAVELRGRQGHVDKYTLDEARMLLEGRRYADGEWPAKPTHDSPAETDDSPCDGCSWAEQPPFTCAADCIAHGPCKAYRDWLVENEKEVNPCESDPCVGCMRWLVGKTRNQCVLICHNKLGTCGAYDAFLASQTVCVKCGKLPNYDLYIPRSMWCDECVDDDGNPVHRTVAQWCIENKQDKQ